MRHKYSTIFLIITAAFFFSILQCGSDSGSSKKKSDSDSIRLKGSVVNQTAKGTIIADYVYAVNTCPEYGSTWRQKVSFEADGSFKIDLSKGDPWIIAFIDSTQVGPNMIKGILRAEQLNSVVPKSFDSEKSVDTGELTIDDSGNAAVTAAVYETFIGSLGMTTSEAATLGAMDDLMLRYINPDINGNGVIDIDDPAMPEYSLTFWHTYRYGDATLITNIQNGTALPVDSAISYEGAAPEIRIVKTASGIYSGVPPKWSLGWTNSGNYGDVNPAEWTSGTPGIGVTFNDTDTGLKVMFPATATDVPDGTYTYKFYSAEAAASPDATLTFTNVSTMADATVTTNFIFPFPVFNADASGNVTTIDYTWMKKGASGFVPATAADIEMIIGKNSAEIKWYTASGGDEVGAYITLKPYNNQFAATGTVNFSDATAGASLSPKRADIINLGISFTAKIGLWMKLNITNL